MTATLHSRVFALIAELGAYEPAGAAWLREQLAAGTDPLRVRVAFARVARKFTRADTRERARTALVLSALADHDDPQLVVQLYRAGELLEQQSILRMLAELPAPERFTELAIEACRTNASSVFAALALENPFPASHFPAPAFNQLVLKTLFLGLPARDIVGLQSRATAELGRMVEDFAAERRAAGRSVPDDVGAILQLSKSASAPGDQP